MYLHTTNWDSATAKLFISTNSWILKGRIHQNQTHKLIGNAKDHLNKKQENNKFEETGEADKMPHKEENVGTES